MLNVIDLHTYYGDSHVLQGVTMHVDPGTVTAVLGRNGVGKTTLCRSLAGLTPARAGRIVLNGIEITRLSPHRICGIGISMVPQGRRIFPSLTVDENLAIAARARASVAGARESWDVQKVSAVFPRLAERRRHRGNELSGGEQQMLAIARALVANPVLLVMDEPTEGLAPMLVKQVAEMLVRIAERGVSILLVEQKLTIALTISRRVYVMGHGRVVFEGAPEDLRRAESVRKEWLEV